jgi:threonine dehydrogenase-like Zn-dependent dehydrogenase
MRAAWYERGGPASEVLTVGEMDAPRPGPGEVLVRVRASGVNPGDIKKRADWMGFGIGYPRAVPNSDGAGVIEGEGVLPSRVGERVWVWGAQSGRPFGTAAVPEAQSVPLPDGVGFEAGACLGIPARTAHRCVFADGAVAGETVLVAGGAGAVGGFAVSFAKWGGAEVIVTVGSEGHAEIALEAGAHHVLNYRADDVAARVAEITGGSGGPRRGGRLRAQPRARRRGARAARDYRRLRLRRRSRAQAAVLAAAVQERDDKARGLRRPPRGCRAPRRRGHHGVPERRVAPPASRCASRWGRSPRPTRRWRADAPARGWSSTSARGRPRKGPRSSWWAKSDCCGLLVPRPRGRRQKPSAC